MAFEFLKSLFGIEPSSNSSESNSEPKSNSDYYLKLPTIYNMESIIDRMFLYNSYEYDPDIDYSIYHKLIGINVNSALCFTRTHIATYNSGGPLSYVGALAYEMEIHGFHNYAIITSYECGKPTKFAIAYVDNRYMLRVCDIANYVDDEYETVLGCVSIFYNDYRRKEHSTFLHDIHDIKESFIKEITKCSSNITPYEMIQRARI